MRWHQLDSLCIAVAMALTYRSCMILHQVLQWVWQQQSQQIDKWTSFFFKFQLLSKATGENSKGSTHCTWASCQIRKIAGGACAENVGNVSPATAGKRSRHASRHVRDARGWWVLASSDEAIRGKTFPAFLAHAWGWGGGGVGVGLGERVGVVATRYVTIL